MVRSVALLVRGHKLVRTDVSHVQLLRALHPVKLSLGRVCALRQELLPLLLILRLPLLALLPLQSDHEVVVDVWVEVVLIVREFDPVPLAICRRACEISVWCVCWAQS